jgi:Tol biopolymer transport system component
LRAKGAFAVILATCLQFLGTGPALASVGVKQVSVTRGGYDAVRDSFDPSVSADGRYVAFASFAGDLVPGDHTNELADIFVRDTVQKTTVRASVDAAGGDPDGSSFGPSISADGRFVAFRSLASDLVDGDENGLVDVFVRDLLAGTTIRASVDMGGGDPNGASGDRVIAMSMDDRFVAFQSDASNLVEGDANDVTDVFVRDLVTGTTVRASVDSGGGDPDGVSSDPSLSADGRYVAFDSDASDIVAGDGNGAFDVFVRDLVAGTVVRASVDRDGGDPGGDSYNPSITADGQSVAFSSFAPDLIQGDGNRTVDTFVRDLMAGTTIRASVDMGGGDPNDGSFSPHISADGRAVAFMSPARDLVAGDGNDDSDIFVRDLSAGITIRVSVNLAGGDANGPSLTSSISAGGGHVAFDSFATDLVPGPGDVREDVYVARWS